MDPRGRSCPPAYRYQPEALARPARLEADTLAGWRLALEAMEPGDPAVRRQVGRCGGPTTTADLLDWFRRADVAVFASTHTGLPYAQVVPDGGRRRLVVNNGTAGLGNFAGTGYG